MEARTSALAISSGAHYQPLFAKNNKDTFRLLILEAGKPEDPIICQLRIATLSSYEVHDGEHVYDAVSHAWGPRVNTTNIAPIQLGAWQITVRENLYHFLQAVRSRDECITLWIDALCIDQENFEERSYQVQIMDRIYKSARRVLVWLGTGDPEKLLAMDLIEDISATPARATSMSPSDSSALLAWTHCPYWTRTWVVQEFLLARDVMVICGHRRLDWPLLAKFLRSVQFMTNKSPDGTEKLFESPAFVLMRQRMLQNAVRIPLEKLLIQNQHTECEDPYDKVYAMLGLATAPKRGRTIVPNYKEDLRCVLLQVLDDCQIPAGNLARYVRFFGELLSISKEKIMSPLGRCNTMASRKWNLTAFSVGYIIHAVRLTEKSFPTSLRDDYAASQQMQRFFTEFSSAHIERMLNDLTALYSEVACSLLGDSHRDSGELKQSAITAHLVAVLTKHCIDSKILLGLGFGNVKRDKDVSYFLGHHLGTLIEDSRVNGVIVCAQPIHDLMARDLITQQRCGYWTLQNETHLQDPHISEQIQLSNAAILKLSQ